MKMKYTALLLTLFCVGDVFASVQKENKFIDKAKDGFKDLGDEVKDLGGKIDLGNKIDIPKVNPEDLDKDFHDQPPLFDVFGFTSINAIDLTEGFASGIYDKDVRQQYNQCIIGLPTFALKIYAVFEDMQIKSIGDVIKDFKKLTGLVGVITDIFSEAPEDWEACMDIWDELTGTFKWIMKHLSFSAIFGSLFANLTTHFLKVGKDAWQLVMAMIKKDYYEMGKDFGELIMILFD